MASEQKAMPVSDRPAELWIKLLFFITAIAVALTAYIGNRVIDGQDRMTEEVSKMNGSLRVYGSRLSGLELRVKDINDTVIGNTDRIYKLEGAK